MQNNKLATNSHVGPTMIRCTNKIEQEMSPLSKMCMYVCVSVCVCGEREINLGVGMTEDAILIIALIMYENTWQVCSIGLRDKW